MSGWTDPDGVEWVRPAEAVAHIPRLRRATLDSWTSRGKVRRRRSGRDAWVAWTDVLEQEARASSAGWRTGRRAERSTTPGQESEPVAR